jgi:hypothetical protein
LNDSIYLFQVGESLRAFLKAEEMSTKGCTESQIVQDMNKRVPLSKLDTQKKCDQLIIQNNYLLILIFKERIQLTFRWKKKM